MSTAEDRAFDARQDRIADDQAEREAAELRADRNNFEEGDHVRVGNGKKAWVIDSFTEVPGTWLAHLEPLTGYSRTSAEVGRLKAVQG